MCSHACSRHPLHWMHPCSWLQSPPLHPLPAHQLCHPHLMIPAALACFKPHGGMGKSNPTGASSMAHAGGFASASRIVEAETAGDGSSSSRGVVHDHALQCSHDPAASCRISSLQAKPLQTSQGQTISREPTEESHVAGQASLQVVWQVEHPSPTDPLAAGSPAGSTAIALQQTDSAAHAMGDLIAALQRSMSTGGAMTHQIVTKGSCSSHDGHPGRMAGSCSLKQSADRLGLVGCHAMPCTRGSHNPGDRQRSGCSRCTEK